MNVVRMFCLALIAFATASVFAEGPYLATGIKIGEVTPDSAIIWARTTLRDHRIGADGGEPRITYPDPATGEPVKDAGSRPDVAPKVELPEGKTIDDLEGAVPGAPGQVRVSYRPVGTEVWTRTAWTQTDRARDFALQWALSGLAPATKYDLLVEAAAPGNEDVTASLDGHFRTAPKPDTPARVVFTVITGQGYDDQDVPGGGFNIYPEMQKLDPDFFAHTGDILYYDRLAKSLELARWDWARMFSLPTNFAFHREVNSYFEKDDHETWMNDCYPTMQSKFMGTFTFKQGQAVFLEQVPMGERTYRTARWGQDLQVWFVEGRDFRSPNDLPDGPEKSIWGAEQKAWFKKTVQESDATFRLLISPTPLVGPDRQSKNDNLANAGFATEGNELRAFIAAQKNMAVICGDRHWQYMSVDPKTGLREYSCGPASDQHAGGWPKDKRLPEHRYLNVCGGFLSVTVDRPGGEPTATFRYHSVDGKVLFEDTMR